MQRIKAADMATATGRTKEILDNVRKSMGGVPNIISTMANSPAVAEAYLRFSQALSTGVLAPRLREQLALTVGEANSCLYCVSAHSVLGVKAGLSAEDVDLARRGKSTDPAEAAALVFARKLVSERGRVCDSDLETLRSHEFCDGAISEIVAHVGMNLFTNYFNHVAATEVDFPAAKELVA